MDRIPFTFGQDLKAANRRKRSRKQEKRWAEKVGGKVQSASGAMPFAKGDVRAGSKEFLESFLWELKYTDKGSYRITLKEWDKIRQEAYLSEGGQLPGFKIEFSKHDYPSLPRPLRLVILEEEDFLCLKEDADKWNKRGEEDDSN